MILAAGLGTRLRPLTDRIPKALIPIAGVPMLERVALRLIDAGVDRLIINIHHLGDHVREFVEARGGFGVDVLFSEEKERALETGGGLLHAAPLFRGEEPFFLYNADVLSDFPLRTMYRQHVESDALATLAVMQRESSRQLLFDDRGLLGRTDRARDLRLEARAPEGRVSPVGFAGVHVVSPGLLERITEQGAFSILDTYLRLTEEGVAIRPFRIDEFRWIDIGKPEQLAAAEAWLERSLP